MLKRKSVAAAVMVILFGSLVGRLCAADEKSDSGAALAMRLTELAQRILRGEAAPSEPGLRQAEALLKAAVKCDATDPRYMRLLADSQIALHDNAGAVETLTAMRPLQPEDQIRQLEYIDLIVDRIESVDQKLSYLQGL